MFESGWTFQSPPTCGKRSGGNGNGSSHDGNDKKWEIVDGDDEQRENGRMQSSTQQSATWDPWSWWKRPTHTEPPRGEGRGQQEVDWGAWWASDDYDDHGDKTRS